MKNKCIQFIIITMLCLMAFAASAFAESAPSVTLGTASGKMGDSVTIPVVLADNSGFISLGIEVGYDEKYLELTAVEPENIGASYTFAKSIETNPYNMLWTRTRNCTYNGTIATLTFRIITDKAGSYPVTVNYYKGRDGNWVDGKNVNYKDEGNVFVALGLTYANGSVTVEATEKSITATNSSTGTQLSCDVTLSGGEYTGTVIAGLYSAGGQLQDIVSYPAEESHTVAFNNGKTGTYAKIMWWSSINKMVPLCGSETVNFNSSVN